MGAVPLADRSISIALGFINVLPIPFLDGGRVLFIVIEAVRRKRLDPRHEALAYAIGAAFVILAVVLITHQRHQPHRRRAPRDDLPDLRPRVREPPHSGRRRLQSRPMTPPNRRRTVPIRVGSVVIGGAAPISVQTMTKTQTEDVAATLAQIERAAKSGADIVRVTCDTPEAGEAMREIVRNSPLPIVADVHYDAPRALEALEAGVACLRLPN